jgi:hypothetical protein
MHGSVVAWRRVSNISNNGGSSAAAEITLSAQHGGVSGGSISATFCARHVCSVWQHGSENSESAEHQWHKTKTNNGKRQQNGSQHGGNNGEIIAKINVSAQRRKNRGADDGNRTYQRRANGEAAAAKAAKRGVSARHGVMASKGISENNGGNGGGVT